jgi:hypothetical protein
MMQEKDSRLERWVRMQEVSHALRDSVMPPQTENGCCTECGVKLQESLQEYTVGVNNGGRTHITGNNGRCEERVEERILPYAETSTCSLGSVCQTASLAVLYLIGFMLMFLFILYVDRNVIRICRNGCHQ